MRVLGFCRRGVLVSHKLGRSPGEACSGLKGGRKSVKNSRSAAPPSKRPGGKVMKESLGGGGGIPGTPKMSWGVDSPSKGPIGGTQGG